MFKKIFSLMLCMLLIASAASADVKTVDMAADRGIEIHKAADNTVEAGISPTTGRTLSEVTVPENFTGLAAGDDYLPIMVQIPNEGGGAWFGSYADVVYESAKSRGGDTRYTMVFSDTIPEWVGPTRSIRAHHVFIREEWNVPFLYTGHQENAGNVNGTDVSSEIRALGWRVPESTDTSKVSLFYDGTCSRDWSPNFLRVVQLARPNNAVVYVPGIMENVVPKGQFTPVNHAYRFADEAPAGGDDAGNIYVMWNKTQAKNSDHNILLQYENGVYYRYTLKNRNNPDASEPVLELAPTNISKTRTDEGTQVNMRRNSGEQLSFSNVIIQYIPMKWYSNEELRGTLTGTGNADIFMGGKHYAGVWNRDTLQERTVFYGENGEEMPMMRGKTLIILMDYENELRAVEYE